MMRAKVGVLSKAYPVFIFLGVALAAFVAGELFLKYKYIAFVPLLGLPLLALFFRHPLVLLGILFSVSYFMPLTVLLGRSAFTINRLLGVLLLGILFIRFAARKERWILPPNWYLLMGACLCGILGFLIYGVSRESQEAMKDLLSAAFILFFAIQLVQKEKHIYSILWLIPFCTSVAALFALYQFFFRGGLTSRELVRVGGFFHSNIFASSMTVVIPIFFLLYRRSSRWGRMFLVANLFLAFLSIIISASRGGFISALTVICLLVWKRVISLRLFLLGSLLLVLSLPYLPVGNKERLFSIPLLNQVVGKTPSRAEEDSTRKRIGHFIVGGNMLLHNPWGVGIGNYRPAYIHYRAPGMYRFPRTSHNSYIMVFCEYGLLGGFALFAFFIFIFRKGKGERKMLGMGSLSGEMALFLKICILGFAVVGLISNTILYDRTFWLFLGLLYAIHRIQVREAASKPKNGVKGYLPVPTEI